jgi:hypothetical protein
MALITIPIGSKMGDFAGEGEFEGREYTRLSHAIRSIDEHNLSIEWNDDFSLQAAEILDHQSFKPCARHLSS